MHDAAQQESPAAPTASISAQRESEELVRRSPAGYFWNQAFSLWLFVSLLLLQIVIARSLSTSEAGVYSLVATTANLGFYLASIGLSSAGTVYLPRALAEGGPSRAMALALRLVAARLAAVIIAGAAFLWGLPGLATALAATRLSPAVDLAQNLTSSVLLEHRAAIAAYIVAIGMANLLGALLVALMRARIVFVVGGLGQLLLVVMAYVLVHLAHGGVDAAMAAQALPSALMAIVYAIALNRVLHARASAGGRPLLWPVLQLGVASWLADLPGTSLVKQLAITQLALVATQTQLAFFDRSYQMGDAAAVLFIEGLAGVSMAAMSAAYIGQRLAPLSTAWRTVSKLQMLLAAPLVVFCVPQASAIMRVLYTSKYAAAGPFLALFLVLNGLVQVLGGGAHQWALYVLGRQRWVVVSQWIALGVLALVGIVLTPRFGVAGALLSIGVARLIAQVIQLAVARSVVGRAYPVAFVARMLVALVLPAALSALWRPGSLVGLILAGAAFLAIFLVSMRLIRPLDAEDGLLIAQAAAPLRAALLPFVARTRHDTSPRAAERGTLAARATPSQPLTVDTSTAPPHQGQ
jgi:O-antigen/teichoic acid export membrane protein